MRALADADRIGNLMYALAQEADRETRLYFTGGATAVLMGWRGTTIDVDLKFVPESDRLLRAIPHLKEKLQVNVELASPSDFIPQLPGWEERSRFIGKEGKLSFFHYRVAGTDMVAGESGRDRRSPVWRGTGGCAHSSAHETRIVP